MWQLLTEEEGRMSLAAGRKRTLQKIRFREVGLRDVVFLEGEMIHEIVLGMIPQQ
jgi:hypothetical protein